VVALGSRAENRPLRQESVCRQAARRPNEGFTVGHKRDAELRGEVQGISRPRLVAAVELDAVGEGGRDVGCEIAEVLWMPNVLCVTPT